MKYFLYLLLFTLVSCASKTISSSKDQLVKDTLRSAMPEIRNCYQKIYVNNKKRRKMKVKASFTIESNGLVNEVLIKSKYKKKFDQCIGKAIVNLKFPKVKDGKTIKVKTPIHFYTKKVKK